MCIGTDDIDLHELPQINSLLADLDTDEIPASSHFTADERFFLKLPEAVEIQSFPIHHDVRKNTPPKRFLDSMISTLSSLTDHVPGLFRGCTYTFDPAYPLEPLFYRILRNNGERYVYMFKLALSYSPAAHEVVRRGSNDVSPSYRTNRLPVDSFLLPLVQADAGTLKIRRYISSTWIGETGRGYLTQGIWMDRDFTRILSQIVLKEHAKTHPWYPVCVRQNTLGYAPVEHTRHAIDSLLPHIARLEAFFAPHMSEIETLLRNGEKTRIAELADELTARYPPDERKRYTQFQTKAYLNEFDQKEYRIEHTTV